MSKTSELTIVIMNPTQRHLTRILGRTLSSAACIAAAAAIAACDRTAATDPGQAQEIAAAESTPAPKPAPAADENLIAAADSTPDSTPEPAAAAPASNDGPLQVDPDLSRYEKTSGVAGSLNSIGSDTLNNLMTAWAESFKDIYPNVTVQIEGKGSSTAPPALIEGTAQLGPMSRPMKEEELDLFESKFGFKPTQVPVAIDALAVFAHKDNPVKGLTMQELDGIFSSTLKAGGDDIETWGDLGLTGQWATRPISLYGRNSASGTYGFFKDEVLLKGDYKASVKEQPGSSAVVQGVETDPYGLGYSGVGYKTAGVRAVPLGSEKGDYYEATLENAISGDYPLARFLYVYVNKKPGEPLDKLTAEFLKFVLAEGGQKLVIKDGYFPLPAEVAAETLAALE